MIRETLIEPEFFRQDFSMMYEEIIRFRKQTVTIHSRIAHLLRDYGPQLLA